MITASCGAVVRRIAAGPVGELVTPPPLPKFYAYYASGGTRRNSGGDCLPSLSFS